MTARSAPKSWHLRQLSMQACGHTLNHRQVFSPSGNQAYFDSRNADPEIMVTDRIGRIDLETGESEWVYQVPRSTPFGPGVGAVACNPHRDRLIFIHGLINCDVLQPYSATRRFGALLDAREPSRSIAPAEARCLTPAPRSGSLRGGTHAHSWSADGLAISFTYNDAWIDQQHRKGLGPPDLRTVGMMWTDRSVQVSEQDCESFSGKCYAMVVAAVSHIPRPGTDTIESAREECFLGKSSRELAFIGRVRNHRGDPVDEVFVARWDLPPERRLDSMPIDADGRLIPPEFVQVDRVTRSENRRYPGMSGPRSWLVSSPEGNRVYGPMRDESGMVQVAEIDVVSGRFEYVTRLDTSLESPLTLDRSGTRISLVSEGRIGIVDLVSREIRWSPDLREMLEIPWGAIHFLPEEEGCLFHAYPRKPSPKWQQLWTLTLH